MGDRIWRRQRSEGGRRRLDSGWGFGRDLLCGRYYYGSRLSLYRSVSIRISKQNHAERSSSAAAECGA